jgi:hypothetical protein
MAGKLSRLLDIPQPHRNGMIFRTLAGKVPGMEKWRSDRYARRLEQLSSKHGVSGTDGPRYLATTAHRTAGIGHVLSEYNTGLLLARAFDLEFLHSTLASPWEEFLGFGSGFSHVEPLWKQGGFDLVRLPNIDWKASDPVAELKDKVARVRSHKPLLFMPFDGQNSFRQHTTGLELRQIYWNYANRPNSRILREKGRINVAVHIRRRNAMDMKNPSVHDISGEGYRSRYIDLEYFEQLMEIITEALGYEVPVFHIFSQGTADGFEPLLCFPDVRLHLDVDQYNTFHNMACADILITSPSSFSFKAGMLTPGLKLSRYPWWHEIPEDKEWCRIPEEPKNDNRRIAEFIQINLPDAQKNASQIFPFSL